jgi:hypothetical protein
MAQTRKALQDAEAALVKVPKIEGGLDVFHKIMAISFKRDEISSKFPSQFLTRD